MARPNTCRFMEGAPTWNQLVPKPSPERKRLETEFVFTVPTFGLSAADIEAGKLAEFERAELRAWSMLRSCQWCQRRFVPARGNCSCCSRRCYLKHYRKREAVRYAGYTRRWRNKVS
jgi:hypothetical protein